MIDITEINRIPNQVFHRNGDIELLGYFVVVNFVLFNKIVCSCEFEIEIEDLEMDIKAHIENQLTEDFNKAKQLEGKPSNLKTK